MKKERQADTERQKIIGERGVVSYQLKREWNKRVWQRKIELRRRQKKPTVDNFLI